jgi:diguanylate cyclase (GGDEF)-like protein
MPALLQAIATLTEHRDRALLDQQVLDLLAQCVPGSRLRVLGCVGEAPAQRLLLRASARPGEPACAGLPPWTPLDALPRVADCEAHSRAQLNGEPVLGIDLNVFPLFADRHCFGMVELHRDDLLDDRERLLVRHVLRIYANHVGLLNYGEIDTLTGLLNRKTFDAQFRASAPLGAASAQLAPDAPERRRGDASVLPRWLGLVDIDHFKKVNDGFGHLIGDEMLLLVAGLLRSSFRHGDCLYRFGGEEFVVLLHAADRCQAAIAFERFRVNMAEHRFPQVGHATASVGFTALWPNDSPAGAFERADRAVYHAKDHGRNQVRCYEDLLEAGALEAVVHVGEIELF